MGASRKTDNYNLPLWDGPDKFTITGDLNHTNEIIDSTLKNNEDTATRASNLAADSNARVIEVANSVDTKITSATNDIKASVATSLSAQNDSFNKTISDVHTSASNLEASVDHKLAKNMDDVSNAITQVPKKFLVDIVGEYGADPTGKTDTAIIFNSVTDSHPDGCVIFFRPGTYLFNQSIKVVGSTRIIGSGSVRASVYGAASDEHGGTFLDFRVPATQRSCFTFDRYGTFTLEHICIGTKGQDTVAPFITLYEKTAIIYDVSFSGPPSQENGNCTQDAIRFGDSNSIFQGYGTRVSDVSFNRIRTCLALGRACNGVMITNVVITGTCGSSTGARSAIDLDGTGDQCTANVIDNVVCEAHAYPYIVSLGESKYNVLSNFQAWDTTVAPSTFDCAILFKANSNSLNNIFRNFYLDLLGFDRMSKDNRHLCWHNSYDGVGHRSAPFMTEDQMRNTSIKYPTGSLALRDTDAQLFFYNGAEWIQLAKA